MGTGAGPDLRAYLFALAPAGVALAVAPALASLPTGFGVGFGSLQLVGLPLTFVGFGLTGWAVHSFAGAGGPPSPTSETEQLVTAGALAHTRNPLYLGTVLVAASAGLALDTVMIVGYAGALWLVYHLLTVYREEPELRAAFDGTYRRYCERVPRWFPRFW